MERVPMTVHGAEALRQELHELKTVKRKRIIEAIATAREHGDLSENAEYHAAKEEQSFNEGRISDIEGKLACAHIINPADIKASKVVFGAAGVLIDLDSGREVEYQIVGIDEADLEKGKISVTSPIARALIGKEEGDVAVVQAPSGEREYEVQEIRYE
ncbi:MAG: transcription elongation factor GreA [Mariprofundaceae bacterium]